MVGTFSPKPVVPFGELKFGIERSGILICSLLPFALVVYCIVATVRPRGDALNARGITGCRFPTSSSSVGDGRRIGDRLCVRGGTGLLILSISILPPPLCIRRC